MNNLFLLILLTSFSFSFSNNNNNNKLMNIHDFIKKPIHTNIPIQKHFPFDFFYSLDSYSSSYNHPPPSNPLPPPPSKPTPTQSSLLYKLREIYQNSNKNKFKILPILHNIS